MTPWVNRVRRTTIQPAVSPETTEPPDATFVRRRWVPRHRAEWARGCDQILLEYGAVTGTTIYPERHQARWGARYLIQLLVELDMHPRPELREHTDRKDGGWVWTVEYVRPTRRR